MEKKDKTLKMVASSCYIPKENKLKPRGEDAHFICQEMQTVGVADGVGGWSKRGVDAGEYARQLMDNSLFALYSQDQVNPSKILEEAQLKTQVNGSSTACIVTLEGDHLKYVNVGDSGFILFREKKMVYRTMAQQYCFNHPYQVKRAMEGLKELAVEAEVKVESGDVAVIGTDGLFDNIFAREIEEILEDIEGWYWPDQLAWSLARVAHQNSLDEDYVSPFGIHALNCGERRFVSGGKYDDITVVVVQIE